MGTNVFDMIDGKAVELTEEENNARIAERKEVVAAMEAEAAAIAWLTGRQEEYGQIASQLDEMFHDFDAWKARIQEVKNKYPKP